MADYLSSELILTPDNKIYHLEISANDLAKKVILVGDQDRVKLVSAFFDTITHKSQHREFACHTGFYKGKEISVISTGIGTDNIDIVMNELDALVNIDFNTRSDKNQKTELDIVRIGTCGILQDTIPVESFILTKYAMGIDNIGHFYQRKISDEEKELTNQINQSVRLPKEVIPYVVKASPTLNKRLISENVKSGITVTSSGFYGPQGRKLRLPLAEENMVKSLRSFKSGELQFTNFEMEASALITLATSLGHQATAICLGLANRKKKEFSTNYKTKIIELIEYVLERI